MNSPFPRVAVLGTGLIGGSFALAMRATGSHIIGYDKPEILEQARQAGAIDEGTGDIAVAVRAADLIYVALPVGAALDALPAIARNARAEALVTDVGGTKVRICEAATKVFQPGARFLGGHPMAGAENGGIAHARADLFRDAKYALIAEESDSDSRVRNFAECVCGIGATPVWLDAETHDWAAAIISHLPQLTAIALAGVVKDETDETGLPLTMAGPGLRDALRLAGSPYEMWRDVCLTNEQNISRALERLINALEHLRSNLKTRELAHEFDGAREVYKILHGMK